MKLAAELNDRKENGKRPKRYGRKGTFLCTRHVHLKRTEHGLDNLPSDSRAVQENSSSNGKTYDSGTRLS